jgi:hypothetical protein
MIGHFFFSIFSLNGDAIGKADIDVEIRNGMGVGDRVELVKLSSLRTAAHPSPTLPSLLVKSVTDRANGEAGIELEDLILPNSISPSEVMRYLSALGFDCDQWYI